MLLAMGREGIKRCGRTKAV